jgi:DNA-directed RNA polymerase subunit E'
MFKLITIEDTIRIPPEKFGKPLDKAAYEELKARYEGIVTEDLGYVVFLKDVKVSPVGKIIPGDGATYNSVTFSIITFYPQIQEIVEGEVVEVEDFGAFVRVGPIDALLHVSQIIDDFVSFDDKQAVLIGKETQRRLKAGDSVRTRITAVSFAKGGTSGKVGLTMRQPFLGKLEWIVEDVKKLHEATQVKTVAQTSEEGSI